MSDDKQRGYMEPPEAILHEPSGGPVPYGPDLGWRKFGNVGPSTAYVEVDDVLLWETWSTAAGITVNLSIRVLRADGVIVPILAQALTTANTVTPVTARVTLPSGFILSATVTAPGAGHGQTYTRLSVQRGLGSSDVTRGDVLLNGFPSQFTNLAFPEMPLQPALSGFGLVVFQAVTQPAAGADWTFTVPAGLSIMIRGIRAQFVTSAAVANRLPVIQITDGVHIAASVPARAVQAASLTVIYDWAAGLQSVTAVSTVTVSNNGWPMECRLLAGMTINSVTQAIDVADQWSQVVLETEQWFAN